MIRIPYDLGITGTVFTKRKSVYFNEFEGSAFYVEEADNMKTLDKIQNFLFLPMLGIDGEPNGIIHMLNFKEPLSPLKVRKMIAMKKFIGAVYERIIMQQKNLETQLGFGDLLGGVNNALNAKT